MKATIKLEDGRTLDVTINDEQLKQFTKDEPMTWEKLVEVDGWYIDAYSEIFRIKGCRAFNKNKGIYPTKEHAEAALAEAQLLQLHNWYRDGWKPTMSKFCWVIILRKGKLKIWESVYESDNISSFIFQSKEIAERFLNEQRELLEVWAKKFSA